jgi:cytidylate kinase
MVDDTPGQLGRLFGELGELDVNVEDLRLEHSPGAQFGLAEISVDPRASVAPSRASSAAGRLRACPHDRHARHRDRRPGRLGQVQRVQAGARLGYGYLDTGAAYRALAWHVLERGATPPTRRPCVAAADFPYAISLDPDDYWVRVGDDDVTDAIREPRVTAAVSGVARVPAVRAQVNELFRARREAAAPASSWKAATSRPWSPRRAGADPAHRGARGARRPAQRRADRRGRRRRRRALHRRDAADSPSSTSSPPPTASRSSIRPISISHRPWRPSST